MALRLFNTLTRSTQDFVPLDPAGRRLGLYCCGPTVHDFAHIGNFRTFVFADLVRRYLEFKGYEVQHVMNVTDVEDKIIHRVAQAGGTLKEYTAKYEAAFFEDLDALGCLRPRQIPHATEHIAAIIALIEALADHGITYRAGDGSVYFSIEKYRAGGGRYGQIAQSQGAGRPFVKYWLHGAHLLVEGKKMSKSLGNYFTLRDLLGKGFTGREMRCLLLTAHYREPFNFTFEGLRGARAALARLDECLDKLRTTAAGATAAPDDNFVGQFTAAMDEDLNVSAAWGAIFEWVRENNRLLAAGQLSALQAAAALAAWDKIDAVLGLKQAGPSAAPAPLLALLEERQAARKAKDFKRADAIRDELKSKGWTIEDTPKGARLKPL